METRLQVPYRDTAADDLVWRLGEARHPALAVLELEVPGGARVELRLLGGSHQVLFSDPRTVISEVVACEQGQPERDMSRCGPENGPRARQVALPAARPGLPAVAERALDGWDYRFRSRTHSLAPARFGHRVDGLVARLAGHPDAIVGRFPGSPHAVTALLAGTGRDGAVRWRTWHAYPQDRRLVATRTTVRPRTSEAAP